MTRRSRDFKSLASTDSTTWAEYTVRNRRSPGDGSSYSFYNLVDELLKMVRETGFEPVRPAWKAGVLGRYIIPAKVKDKER